MSKLALLFIMLAALTLSLLPAAQASSTKDAKKPLAEKVTPAMLAKGQAVYEQSCAVCHASGVAGAPKFGDKAAWKEHIAHGLEHMVETVIRGKGAMPPRGGNAKLSDSDIRAAVAYLAEKSR